MAESIEQKRTLLSMARTFRTDIQDIQQRGAGYYSCDPFVSRYNKLLAKTRELFADEQDVLLDSFEEVTDIKSVDPADKMKVTQRVLIELGQLIAFIESKIKQEEENRHAIDESPMTKESGKMADGEESPNVTE